MIVYNDVEVKAREDGSSVAVLRDGQDMGVAFGLVKAVNDLGEARRKEEVRRSRNGWIGKGLYTCKHPANKVWRNMFGRSHARDDLAKWAKGDPDCMNSICSEWEDFQSFAVWWDAQHESRYVKEYKLQLDKDLFGVWVRLYGPNTCVLLPRSVNGVLRYYDPTKGIKQRKNGKWYLTSPKYRKRVARNTFESLDDAYWARADLMRAEIIGIVAPIRHIFSERTYHQLVTGYWAQLRHYMQPSVQAVAEVERKAEEEAAKHYH